MDIDVLGSENSAIENYRSLLTQAVQNPAFGHLNADFGLGFIPRFPHPPRDHHHAVVLGKFLVAGVEIRFVVARFAPESARIVKKR